MKTQAAADQVRAAAFFLSAMKRGPDRYAYAGTRRFKHPRQSYFRSRIVGLSRTHPDKGDKMTRVYRISEIVKPRGPVSRSTLYAHAAAGLIELRKRGGVTVVREEEWVRYLSGEPMAREATGAR